MPKKTQDQKPFALRFPTRESAILELLANNVRSLRAARGMSQQTLADTVEIEQTEISKIENQRGNPTVLTLEKLAAALGVTVPALLEPEATKKRRVGRETAG